MCTTENSSLSVDEITALCNHLLCAVSVQTWEKMALDNFLSFIAVSMFCVLAVSLKLRVVKLLHWLGRL